MAITNETPLLVDRVREFTSKHGGDVFEITLIDLEDAQEYHTYIDPKNHNFKHWAEIISHSDDGFIITGLTVKKTKKAKNLLNADNKPEIEIRMSGKQELLKQIEEHLAKQKEKEENPFNRLFGEI